MANATDFSLQKAGVPNGSEVRRIQGGMLIFGASKRKYRAAQRQFKRRKKMHKDRQIQV